MPICSSGILQVTAAAKAFADGNRVRILAALQAGELCVCELCDALQLSQSTLSTHLQVVRAAGLVRSRRDGKWSYYTLTPGGRRLSERLFRLFSDAVVRDPGLVADRARLKERLRLREAGTCCVGFRCAGGAKGGESS